jgi:hypothetical protein
VLLVIKDDIDEKCKGLLFEKELLAGFRGRDQHR